jgi:hypothetical protein
MTERAEKKPDTAEIKSETTTIPQQPSGSRSAEIKRTRPPLAANFRSSGWAVGCWFRPRLSTACCPATRNNAKRPLLSGRSHF